MAQRNPLLVIVSAMGLAFVTGCAAAPTAPAVAAIDRDLLDVTVPQLHRLYTERKYTVTEVVQWHLDRIDRYNGVYGAIETVFRRAALAKAAQQDAEAERTGVRGNLRGPLWGVPIVVKANTSIAGQVTTAGWHGFTLEGLELIAPRDATVVGKLEAAGAIVVGHTNMPDLANSDTNRSSSYGRTGNAYDVRFSPGGSSGGTVTAVAANMAVLGTGTDTGNSIRMPAATSALVGVFPTRGLVSIAGIAPLDWLLDNTGPIARTVTDAAIALSAMAGEDVLDPPTTRVPADAQRPPYQERLQAATLQGKRFAVPAFVLAGDGVPFRGIPAAVPADAAEKLRVGENEPLQPETRALFVQAVDALRRAGAEVIVDDTILPVDFARLASRTGTYPYTLDGTNRFLAHFGPERYHSADEYQRAAGTPLFPSAIGTQPSKRSMGGVEFEQRPLDSDPDAERNVHAPRRAALAAYVEAMDRLRLDGFVYPAIQMPPPDETMPQNGQLSGGPHSATSWVNILGVPAVAVPAGFYSSGLPFGLELSGRPFRDGDLLALAFAFEQATHARRPPRLVEHGLLPITPAREGR